MIDPYKGLGGEYQDKAHAFEGRLSESDNPMLNTLNEVLVPLYVSGVKM